MKNKPPRPAPSHQRRSIAAMLLMLALCGCGQDDSAYNSQYLPLIDFTWYGDDTSGAWMAVFEEKQTIHYSSVLHDVSAGCAHYDSPTMVLTLTESRVDALKALIQRDDMEIYAADAQEPSVDTEPGSCSLTYADYIVSFEAAGGGLYLSNDHIEQPETLELLNTLIGLMHEANEQGSPFTERDARQRDARQWPAPPPLIER